MGSKTISLEDSAYQKLKAAKRPGESFSDVVNRLVGGKTPSILELRKVLAPDAWREVGETIADMRAIQEKIEAERWARMMKLWETKETRD